MKIRSLLSNKDLANNRSFNGWVLVLLFSLFSFTYVDGVISPQFGWWQYYAWRMDCGDVLYKDIYLFMPPYFVFLTRLLYAVFGHHFMLYTLLVGFPVKIACLLLVYRMLCRISMPVYACVSVLFGACLSATYNMDMWYDYNPITMLPCLLIAYGAVKYYENLKSNKGCLWVSFSIGLLIAILFGLKQTFGITFLFTVIVALSAMHYLEKEGSRSALLKDGLILFVGIVVGLLPAIIYLTFNECWNEFFVCLAGIGDAKGGLGHIFLRCLIVFQEFKIWVYALIILWFWNFQKHLHYDGTFLIKGKLNQHGYNIVLISSLILTVIAIILFAALPESFHSDVALGDWGMKWRVRIYKLLVYSGVAVWIVQAVRYFMRKDVNAPIILFTSLLLAHLFTGILSTDFLEEIYLVLYAPWILAIVLSADCSYRIVKDGIVLVLTAAMMLVCISVKRTVPYSWQGWTEPAIKHSHVYSSIDGLEGIYLSKKVNGCFNRFVSLINEHCSSEDCVFQFANIPLFNVLTKKKISSYVPITWFDVCSDSLAISVASELKSNPPKMVIWHKMDKVNWKIVEEVFRGGEKSGQREILSFYENVVCKKYELLFSMDNHRDGRIQLWLRKDDALMTEDVISNNSK